MKLSRYHCDDLTLRLTTNLGNFDSNSFFRDKRLSDSATDWERGTPLELLCQTSNHKLSDYHVHIHIRRLKERVRLVLNWTTPAVRKRKSVSPPSAEDALEWIGAFFRNYVYVTRLHIYYVFPSARFTNTVGLPIPFWGKIKPAKKVHGISVNTELPGALDSDVIVDVSDEESIAVTIFALFRSRLTRMKPQFLLEKLRPLASEFVSPR